MIDEHVTAVLALLNGAITSPRKVFDGKVPDGTDVRATPYVLAYFSGGYPEREFDATSQRFELRITLHCVGGNAQAARMLSDLGAVALLDVRPTVTGRTCWPIWQEEPSGPPQRDESTGSTVMDQIDSYLLASVPG